MSFYNLDISRLYKIKTNIINIIIYANLVCLLTYMYITNRHCPKPETDKFIWNMSQYVSQLSVRMM